MFSRIRLSERRALPTAARRFVLFAFSFSGFFMVLVYAVFIGVGHTGQLLPCPVGLCLPGLGGTITGSGRLY